MREKKLSSSGSNLSSDKTTNQNPASIHSSSNTGASKTIESCSIIYSCLTFVCIQLWPIAQILLAFTKNKILNESTFILAPIAFFTLTLGTLLQPRRNDSSYKALLYYQYVTCCIIPDIIGVGWIDQSTYGLVKPFVRVSTMSFYFRFLLIIRSKVAGLPNKILSRFLTGEARTSEVIASNNINRTPASCLVLICIR